MLQDDDLHKCLEELHKREQQKLKKSLKVTNDAVNSDLTNAVDSGRTNNLGDCDL